MTGLAGHRLGGDPGCFKGFTHTLKCVDRLEVEDELLQDVGDPEFILRNIDLSTSCCGLTSTIAQGYLRRKEIQRIVCSQCLFLAGFLPRIFEHLPDVDRNTKSMAINGPLIGIVGAGGQLGSAITQTFLDFGWKPFRLAVCGRGASKLKRFEALGVGVFDDVSLLVRAVRLVIVAVGPQHARQVGTNLGDAGTGSRLVLSTLAGISEASLKRVLGTQHLLQIRVDVARLDVVETMAQHGGDSSPPPRTTNNAVLLRGEAGGSGQRTAPAHDGSWESFDACQAAHERAALQLIPDRGAAERVFGRLESFFVEQGLDAAHAHEASHDWLPYTAQPESEEPPPQSDAEGSFGGESFTSATHPTKCAAGERRPERAGENQGRRGSRQESSGPPSPPHSPAAQGSPEPSQTRATHLAEASQVRDGEPVDDPLSLQARRVSPPAALTSPGATLGDSNEGGASAEGAGVSGCGDGDGGDDGGTRQGRAATAASLRSARSAGSCGRSPRKHQWRTKHGMGRDVEEGWCPRPTWPPPDLAVIDDLYKEIVHTPYGDAVLSSGYHDGRASPFPGGHPQI